MAIYNITRLKLGGALIALGFILTNNTFAADLAGNVIRTKGEVSAKSAETRTLGSGDIIMEGDTITTGPSSAVQLQMKDGGIIAISENSELKITTYNFNEPDGQEDAIKLELTKGSLRTITGDTPQSSYLLQTPSSVVRIQGTIFDVQAGANTILILREGAITAQSTCEGVPSTSTQLINVPGAASVVQPCEDPTLADSDFVEPLGIASLDNILNLDTAAPSITPPPTPPLPSTTGGGNGNASP